MRAHEIMTRKVVTAPPDISVVEIAWLMAKNKVSGVPVVSPSNGVLGIVSEGDLLRRVELGTDDSPARWTDMYTKPAEMAREFAKSHGTKAHEVMARPVVSVEHDADLKAVADTLDRHGIKRVTVMKDGKLVGIIARSDLVRAFGRAKHTLSSGDARLSDGLVHKAITDAMHGQAWLDTSYMNLTVNNGLIRITGFIQSKEHRDAIVILVKEIPGVDRVEADVEIGLPTLSWDGQLKRNHMLS